MSAPDAPPARRLDDLLDLAVEMGASDLHLVSGESPIVRVMGALARLRVAPVTAAEFEAMIRAVAPRTVWEQFSRTGDLDWSYANDLGRFRVNLFRQERGPAAVFRQVPSSSLSFDALGLPQQVRHLTDYGSGLVLVTGPTGSGKSTTLAALIDDLNRRKRLHILTIEDPIEFVHSNRLSRVTQREIGANARTFSEALRVAMREDPDVILVGELRDLETISMALQAGETGILVLATMHTNSASRTVDRLVNVFPAHEQDAVRGMAAGVLRAILAQQLLPCRTGGRAPACELLFWSTGLPNMIREGKPHLIDNLIRTGRRQGMIAMDESLLDLARRRAVESREAYDRAIDKGAFRKGARRGWTWPGAALPRHDGPPPC
ncbi:MAG: PilT/PilU family type 4a pilus ATPase [Deltaproteobacteria bacterium]|nr:PilT/PilU family type 4a pilus ATPase [Deltaproteobacteria bacterium]